MQRSDDNRLADLLAVSTDGVGTEVENKPRV